MKKYLKYIKDFFIKDLTKFQVGSIVKFEAILREIRGIIEEIRNKKAKVFYLNYGSGSIINWIPLSKLTFIS